jgi:hypothetical protein
MSKLRVKYVLQNSTATRLRPVQADRTIQQVINLIARLDGVDVDTLSLNHCIPDPDELFDDYYDYPAQLFVFSKAWKAFAPSP